MVEYGLMNESAKEVRTARYSSSSLNGVDNLSAACSSP